MGCQGFFEELHRRIAKHDLLCHPFYKAWSAGELTRDDLRQYSAAYLSPRCCISDVLERIPLPPSGRGAATGRAAQSVRRGNLWSGTFLAVVKLCGGHGQSA